MRLAVFDTNVVISAGIRPDRAPARLMMDYVLEGTVQLAICPAIAREYRTVARRRKLKQFGFPPLWLEFLIEESMHLADPAPWPRRGPDPADLLFLALAGDAGAWLVTGNSKHFPDEIREEVSVVSPADYLARLSRSATESGR